MTWVMNNGGAFIEVRGHGRRATPSGAHELDALLNLAVPDRRAVRAAGQALQG